MTEVAISDFRAHIHEYLQKVKLGEQIVLTNRGQQVASLVPPESNDADEKLRNMSKNAYIGDVISPIQNNWELS